MKIWPKPPEKSYAAYAGPSTNLLFLGMYFCIFLGSLFFLPFSSWKKKGSGFPHGSKSF